ncbi:hypothetical protein [Carnobacterium maltaromaticum]|uniref:hypothetical protein n=1 Tax=Carnobacterium maltaromaticum TaxID=2751 RepID=UPI00191B916F|nr:hypothetical protein [Carnobacterium maltaromaticum]
MIPSFHSTVASDNVISLALSNWFPIILVQNVNQLLVVSTFTNFFWFKLVQMINLTKNLKGLKHQQLAGAFFLASIQDNSSALSEY